MVERFLRYFEYATGPITELSQGVFGTYAGNFLGPVCGLFAVIIVGTILTRMLVDPKKNKAVPLWILLKNLPGGVGYGLQRLDPNDRAIIEEAFNYGAIRQLVASELDEEVATNLDGFQVQLRKLNRFVPPLRA